MKKGRKIEPEMIHMLSIKTLKGKIKNDSESDSSAIAGYRFTNDLATALNPEEKIVGLKLTLYIDTLDKNQNKLGIEASYTHEFVFRVDNLADFVGPEEDEVAENEGSEKKSDLVPDETLDPILLGTLAGISYSTLRGIIMSRTQGTALNTVILPVIDPKKLTGLTVEEPKN